MTVPPDLPPSPAGGDGGVDVLVVGAGPAGSTVAGLLAERGWHVLLVDRARFPRPKPCGECLNPGAVAALDRLGLLDAVLSAGPARLAGWDIVAGAGVVARGSFGNAPDAPGSDPLRALALPRETLDLILLDAARSRGARFTEGVRVDSVRPADEASGSGGRPSALIRADGQGPASLQARFIVGADGLRSRVARSLGAIRRSPRIRKVSFTARIRGRGPAPDRGRLVLTNQGTVGLAPVEKGPDPTAWNATVVLREPGDARGAAADPAGFVLAALQEAVPDWSVHPEVVGGPWASGPFDWPTRRITAPGVALVGDAAGYFDPLTGQGIHRALCTAEWAAEAIDRGLRRGRVSREDLAGYTRRVRRALRWSRAVQHTVEAVVARRRLRAVATSRLARSPGALATLLRVTGDVSPPRTLLEPRWWLPLLVPRPEARLADR